LFTDNKTVGFYSIAEKLYIALQQLYSPLVNTIYPYMSHKRNIKFYKKLFTLAILINIFLVFILFINTNEIFKLIFGKVYVESITTFKILLISAVVVVPSILLGYPFLAALGFPKYANLSVVLGSIIHIIGLTILGLTGFINNYSVAFMVLITELFVLGVRLYGVLKNNLWR
jgi:PST family polysaccharide transporter